MKEKQPDVNGFRIGRLAVRYMYLPGQFLIGFHDWHIWCIGPFKCAFGILRKGAK